MVKSSLLRRLVEPHLSLFVSSTSPSAGLDFNNWLYNVNLESEFDLEERMFEDLFALDERLETGAKLQANRVGDFWESSYFFFYY